jgi:hypothetical protein
MKTLGILHSYVKGLPAKKYYWIDETALLFYTIQNEINNKKAITEIEFRYDSETSSQFILGNLQTVSRKESEHPFVKKVNGKTLTNLTALYINNNILNNNINMSPKKIGDCEIPKETNFDLDDKNKLKLEKQKFKNNKIKRYSKLSSILAKTIQDKKNIKITSSKITNWTKSLILLEEKEGVKFSRQKIILFWYADHIDDDYVPVIESGSSFREKFMRLEAAKERDEGGLKKPKSKNSLGSLKASGGKKVGDFYDTPELKSKRDRVTNEHVPIELYVPEKQWADFEKIMNQYEVEEKYKPKLREVFEINKQKIINEKT